MADRKERRFIVREQMKGTTISSKGKFGSSPLTQVCKPKNYDGVNEKYRSFFAMHWKHWPDLSIVDIIPKRESRHTKRNLNVKRKEVIV